MRYIDLTDKTENQITVDREDGIYLGHPTTVLLDDCRTIYTVYPKGHGVGQLVMKRSDDAGLTWSERLPVPDSFSTSLECPTIYKLTDRDGVERLFIFAGRYPFRSSVSTDNGKSWSEFSPIVDFGGYFMSTIVETGKGEVDHGSAARHSGIAEPSARSAVAAQIRSLRVVDFAEEIALLLSPDNIRGVLEPAAEADHQETIVALRGVEHCLAFFYTHSERLLAEHVLSGVESLYSAGGVIAVPDADADGVELRESLQHFVLVGVEAGDSVLCALFLKALFVDVAEGIEFNVGVSEVCVYVRDGDSADSDDSDFEFVHVRFPFKNYYSAMSALRNGTSFSTSAS